MVDSGQVRGSGKLRHLQIRDLWIQERVRAKQLRLVKLSTHDNTADIGTKYLDHARIVKLLALAGLQLVSKGCAAGSASAGAAGQQ